MLSFFLCIIGHGREPPPFDATVGHSFFDLARHPATQPLELSEIDDDNGYRRSHPEVRPLMAQLPEVLLTRG